MDWKKTTLSLVFLALSGVYLISSRTNAEAPQAADTAPASSAFADVSASGPLGSTTGASAPPKTSPPAKTTAPSSSPASAPPPAAKGQYKDGSYTGPSADAYYGYVQVRATITNGKLASIAVLKSPGSQRESISINSRALPMLVKEAITAQSASIHGVSGATDTSQAFIESLRLALTAAKA